MAESFYGEARTEGGGLPRGWKEVSIGEIADIVGGGTPSSKVEKYWHGTIPWLTPKDLSGYAYRRIGGGKRNISPLGLKESSAQLLPKDTVLVTSRAPIGYVALADGEVTTNQGFKNLILNTGYDPEFFYYLIKHNVPKMKALQTGSTFGEISGNSMKQIRLKVPPISEQRRIAEVLGSLDDKIELNRRMSQTLEAISQAVFKSWFVDFDPVIDNALAAGNEIPTALQSRASRRVSGDKLLPPAIQRLFPSEFESSAKCPIPKGWKIGLVGDLIVPTRGKTITKKQAVDGEVPVVAGGLEPAYFHNESNVSAPVVTISSSGANAGFVRLYHQDVWASDCSYISGGQSATPYLWYLFLKMNQGKIYHMQQGAVQPHVYPSDIMRLEMTYPEDGRLWRAIEAFVAVLFSKVRGEKEESATLSKLRDVLLPRLLSGTVSLHESGV